MRKALFVLRSGLSLASWCAVVASAPLALAEESESAPAARERKPAAAHAESAERHGSAFVDPLGFAVFGPRLGVEAGAGHFSGALQARWFNAGLMSHSLFAKGDDKLAFSYGLGLRGRYYLPEGLEGAHLGIAAEYLHSRTEQPPLLLATISSYFVPYAEVGYRLAFGRVYADASAGIGYAFRLSGRIENLPGGTSASLYAASDESSIYGTASLDLGVSF